MENNPKMTPDEMNLALCEMLPEVVKIRHHAIGKPAIVVSHTFYWHEEGKFKNIIHWPTEGLQVCHEAEKLLTDKEAFQYFINLGGSVNDSGWICGWEMINATFEQRREALCRVKFPDRFQ